MWGEDGKHFVSFKTNEEALQKIDYYLTHEEERRKIANTGYRWFHIYHNWTERAKYMNGIIYYLLKIRKENEKSNKN